jgi:hypothetical protein
MELTTLYTLRYVVPGALIVLLGQTLATPNPAALIGAVDNIGWDGFSVSALCMAVGGTLWNVLDARTRLTRLSWEPIRLNISDRLLWLYGPLSPAQEGHLRDGRRLLEVFYRLLDADESLKTKQNGVRMNGLVVTSVADVAGVAMAGAVLHSLFMAIRGGSVHVLWAVGLLGLWAIAEYLLLPHALRRHRALSDEQLDFIDTHFQEELRKHIDRILQSMPPGAAPQG